MKTVKTPCIGVCSTGIGDAVCRGCKRFAEEVIHWNRYSYDEKVSILSRIDALTQQVVSHRIEIFDSELLKEQLDHQGLRYDSEASIYSWAFDLLKGGAGQIDRIEDFGCRVQPEWQNLSYQDLKLSIDENLYVLSTVHFERYFTELA